MTNIELSYRPLLTGLTEQDFDLYMTQPGFAKIVRVIAINPLEDAMKNAERDEFDFVDFKVTKKPVPRKTTSWQKVHSSLLEFLRVRADDSREGKFPGVKYFDGVGYCILLPSLREAVADREKEETSISESPQLFWPQKKRGEDYPRQIIVPIRDYSKITLENARVVLTAKRFARGLEAEVVEAFKEANVVWFERETGYSKEKGKEKFPSREDSPVVRTRIVGPGRYAVVSLVREEVPQYQQIIGMLRDELTDLESGVALEQYKVKRDDKGIFVNIKSVVDTLTARLRDLKFLSIEGRYESAP